MPDIATQTALFEGLLLGTAVGDAIGLPYEGLSSARAEKFFGKGALRHHLLGAYGLCSDDTEHAAMTAQALLTAADNPDRFARNLAWRLRGWFLTLPGGMGLATGRACIRLLLGFPPKWSGVYSAGNGPAMRAPVIGAFFAEDWASIPAFVRASTRLTHTDPKAEEGALVIAYAAAIAAQAIGTAQETGQQDSADAFFTSVLPTVQGEALRKDLRIVQQALAERLDVAATARRLGLEKGVGGYINHTVPIVIHAWLSHYGDYQATVASLVGLGGDTDTAGAIAGALAGVSCHRAGIPAAWLAGVIEWVITPRWLSRLAGALACRKAGEPCRSPSFFWLALPLRNLFFLVLILLHGFRRLFPPY